MNNSIILMNNYLKIKTQKNNIVSQIMNLQKVKI